MSPSIWPWFCIKTSSVWRESQQFLEKYEGALGKGKGRKLYAYKVMLTKVGNHRLVLFIILSMWWFSSPPPQMFCRNGWSFNGTVKTSRLRAFLGRWKSKRLRVGCGFLSSGCWISAHGLLNSSKYWGLAITSPAFCWAPFLFPQVTLALRLLLISSSWGGCTASIWSCLAWPLVWLWCQR